MTDDDTVEDILDDEELDDDLFEDEEPDDDDGEDDPFGDDEDVVDDDDATVPLDASEDDDDELAGEPPVDLAAIEGIEGIDVDDPLEVVAQIEGDADDAIRDGEFVCSSCHMAKRASALADADELLCRDCV
jgi:hypothetical protein